MSGGPPPLRFLALVIGGWVGVRAVMLMPDSAGADPVEPLSLTEESPAPDAPLGERPAYVANVESRPVHRQLDLALPPMNPPRHLALAERTEPAGVVQPVLPWSPHPNIKAASSPADPFPIRIPHTAALAPWSNRWSISGWAFFRRGDAPQLAPGGVLGGSQAGAKLSYALRDDLGLSGRVYTPLRSKGAEASLGLEWQPSRTFPVRLLAERRQSLGNGGRSAFALTAFGGVSDAPVAGPLRLDAYGQAGAVGLRSRDLFIDGSVRVGLPIAGNLSTGAGLWGAAQPGAERLDVGPQISLRFPVPGANLRISADWRMRIAGDAKPGSGPALTLSSDF